MTRLFATLSTCGGGLCFQQNNMSESVVEPRADSISTDYCSASGRDSTDKPRERDCHSHLRSHQKHKKKRSRSRLAERAKHGWSHNNGSHVNGSASTGNSRDPQGPVSLPNFDGKSASANDFNLCNRKLDSVLMVLDKMVPLVNTLKYAYYQACEDAVDSNSPDEHGSSDGSSGDSPKHDMHAVSLLED